VDSVGAFGKLSMRVRSSESEMTYALWQGWLSHLEEFRGLPGWPQSFSLADDGQPRPEKAEPHCAVSLTRRTIDGPGRLIVSKAVFLPLRGAVETHDCEDRAEYSLKLHGCFFVDAGRGGPAETTDERSDETRLKQEWNRRLLDLCDKGGGAAGARALQRPADGPSPPRLARVRDGVDVAPLAVDRGTVFLHRP
jgi:hypothetical protein